jgi:hypothetical protein
VTAPSGQPLALPGAPPAAIGRREAAVRLSPETWAALTAHEATRARYFDRVCRRRTDQCWYWTGAISDTGHAKLRAGTRAAGSDGPPSRVVTAHVYGWHLVYGAPRQRPRAGPPVIAHRCDEASCQNPACWQLDDAAGNLSDYLARRDRPDSPLADVRGPGGRARAIAAAIRAARAGGADIEAAIRRASAVGLPGTQARLF